MSFAISFPGAGVTANDNNESMKLKLGTALDIFTAFCIEFIRETSIARMDAILTYGKISWLHILSEMPSVMHTETKFTLTRAQLLNIIVEFLKTIGYAGAPLELIKETVPSSECDNSPLPNPILIVANCVLTALHMCTMRTFAKAKMEYQMLASKAFCADVMGVNIDDLNKLSSCDGSEPETEHMRKLRQATMRKEITNQLLTNIKQFGRFMDQVSPILELFGYNVWGTFKHHASLLANAAITNEPIYSFEQEHSSREKFMSQFPADFQDELESKITRDDFFEFVQNYTFRFRQMLQIITQSLAQEPPQQQQSEHNDNNSGDNDCSTYVPDLCDVSRSIPECHDDPHVDYISDSTSSSESVTEQQQQPPQQQQSNDLVCMGNVPMPIDSQSQLPNAVADAILSTSPSLSPVELQQLQQQSQPKLPQEQTAVTPPPPSSLGKRGRPTTATTTAASVKKHKQ